MKLVGLQLGAIAVLPMMVSPQSLVGELSVSAPANQYHFATSNGEALQHLTEIGELKLEGEPLLSYQETEHKQTKTITNGAQGIVKELKLGTHVSKGDLLAKLMSPTLLGVFKLDNQLTNVPKILWLCDSGRAFKVKVSYESRDRLFVTVQLNEHVSRVSSSLQAVSNTKLFTSQEYCHDS
ncbi:hypothetical protein [Pseudoalteromonas sp. R3]|uniref:hypothetical protein n=1 Tax=Pseudoalteromonas sp. R3 TaxID=1709477 RepID=UPI0006B686C1|nr:hypothetical protein [Pseudoalteromonas sp. R3]AZZ99956.1 hypothetical protein ELR70_24520 [Pseudoalteromonas sp. R3]